VSVPARRRQVAYGQERGLSARRACTLFSVARSALDYQSRKATRDAPVIERMKALAAICRPLARFDLPKFFGPRLA
jgi:putative transposase